MGDERLGEVIAQTKAARPRTYLGHRLVMTWDTAFRSVQQQQIIIIPTFDFSQAHYSDVEFLRRPRFRKIFFLFRSRVPQTRRAELDCFDCLLCINNTK